MYNKNTSDNQHTPFSTKVLRWSARVLFVFVVLLAFNFNFEAFRAGAQISPVLGGGTPRFIAKWIDPGAFDYNLVNSGTISVVPGSSGSNIITANLLSGISQSIDMWISSSLPAGVTYDMQPSNSVIPTGSRTLNIFTTAATPAGTYPVTVTGSVLPGKTTSFLLIVSANIISFGGSPSVIFSGETASLSWVTAGYSNGQCSINNGIGVANPAASGSVPTPVLTTTTIYRITCDDGTGPEWRDATIIVGSPPTIREIPP